jgi:hypothetical protein
MGASTLNEFDWALIESCGVWKTLPLLVYHHLRFGDDFWVGSLDAVTFV